jgi:hypothetical protein
MPIDIGYPGPGSHVGERSRARAATVAGCDRAEQDGKDERGPGDGDGDEIALARP